MLESTRQRWALFLVILSIILSYLLLKVFLEMMVVNFQ